MTNRPSDRTIAPLQRLAARTLVPLLGLGDATVAERRATFWTAVMFGCALASTFVLRPLRDQFGVKSGVEQMPHLYLLTLIATLLFVPAFGFLASRLPSRRFVPAALLAAAAGVGAVGLGLGAVGDFDWRGGNARWIGEGFWGFYSAFNVAMPSLVWIHAVEHFRREQGRRLFGLVGVGGTVGAIAGTSLAGWLGKSLPPAAAAAASLLLILSVWLCHRQSLRECLRMRDEADDAAPTASEAAAPRATGGAFAAFRLVVRTPRLLAIGGYMMLLGMVATAFAAAQTDIVGREVRGGQEQHAWLAYRETLSQTFVLCLQLFFSGRLLRRLPTAVFLCLLPALSTIGLLALAEWRGATTIAIIEILRRGAQHALERPAREVLYTPLSLEVKHRAKFLLDTFAFRGGDLLGAIVQASLFASAATGTAVGATVVLAAVWAGFGVALGRRSTAPADARAAA